MAGHRDSGDRGAGGASQRPAVLVVDDNPLARALAVGLFEDLGFRVLDAYQGAAALDLVRAHREIGVLFADVRMPGMSGPELAAAALAIRPHLKVVFTSGYVDGAGLPVEASFVPKPWRVDQIVDALGGEAA